jgi:uncharacterized protein (TIGR03067 family)
MKSDLDKLQGTWQVIEFEMDGRNIPPGSARIVIDGDKFTSLSMGAEYEGTMTIDATSKPKSFDVKFHKGPEKGKTSLGIYELDGKTWKICIGLTGVKRPTRFAAEPGTGHALEILTHGAAAKPAAEAAQEAAGEPVAELEGSWQMISCVQNGDPMDAKTCANGRRVFQGGHTTLYMFDRQYMQSSFKVNGGSKPVAIDYLDTRQAGIYEVSGDTLRTAFAAAGEARPKDFNTARGDKRTVSEWKRATAAAPSKKAARKK